MSAQAVDALLPASTASAPSRRIVKLEQAVIDKIAAGEIIHRPSSALKEMIENSLDAGATTISVTVKGGGLQLLQIADNGCGIVKEDFPLICARFATSKISKFNDLSHIQTYGFRGEALASISHVAKVSIVSMTEGSPCAFRATFTGGKMTSEPKACAGNKGTMITVEDMFFDNPAKKALIKNVSEEYNRIIEVVERYAIQHSVRVGFTCKKAGEVSPDVHIAAATNTADSIGLVFGNTVKRELLAFEVAKTDTPEELSFEAKGYVSNANYNTKKSIFVLFINNRLVDCLPLKKAVDAVYSEYLPKHTHPFVYLSINMPPEHVDVNVHPTKREVHFLYQDGLIDAVVLQLQATLKGANTSRTFYTQATLTVAPLQPATSGTASVSTLAATVANIVTDAPVARAVTESAKLVYSVSDNVTTPSVSAAKSRPNKAVRVDSATGSITPFIVRGDAATGSVPGMRADHSVSQSVKTATTDHSEWKEVELLSVRHLAQVIIDSEHAALANVLKRHVFVGVVSRNLSLIQYNTQLLLVNHTQLAREYFHQRVIALFSNIHSFALDPPVDITEMLLLGLQSSPANTATPQEELLPMAQDAAELLLSKAEMLEEYFGVVISQNDAEHGVKRQRTESDIQQRPSILLQKLPRLLENHTPFLLHLPDFLLSLAYDVDWETEMECFHTIAQCLSSFYSVLPPPQPPAPSSIEDTDYIPSTAVLAEDADTEAHRFDRSGVYWQLENVLFPAFREELKPPQKLATDHYFVQLASTEQLYKIFERC